MLKEKTGKNMAIWKSFTNRNMKTSTSLCFAIILLCLPSVYGDEPKGMNDQKFTGLIGRLTRAHIRTPIELKNVVEKFDGETVDDVLVDLEKHFSQLSFAQKKELVTVALINCSFEGGPLTQLLIFLEKDATPIAKELEKISDNVLTNRFGLSSEAITSFRTSVNYLKGEKKMGAK